VRAFPALSTAAQNEAEGQDTKLRLLPGSMLDAEDHERGMGEAPAGSAKGTEKAVVRRPTANSPTPDPIANRETLSFRILNEG
jgi:hypothetical protein